MTAALRRVASYMLVFTLSISSAHGGDWSFGAAKAPDGWTSANTAMEVSYTVFHILDWGQTRYAAMHPNKLFEQNRVLGRHPSVAEVDRYFAATLAGHIAVAYLLPGGWREAFQFSTLVLEVHIVNTSINRRVDLGFGIAF